MAIARRYTRDHHEALGAVNTGFLKIVQNLHKCKYEEGTFGGWMRRVMINSLIDTFRREKKWRVAEVSSDNLERINTDQNINWNEAEQRLGVEQLEKFLQRLPVATRQVFNLFALDGFTHSEIAEKLEISEGTSKWHVSNARTLLQSWISVELYGD